MFQNHQPLTQSLKFSRHSVNAHGIEMTWILEINKAHTESKELDSITNTMDMNLSKLQEIVKGREAWCVVIHGVPKSWTWLSDWTAAAAVCIKSMKTKRRWKEYPQNLKNIHYLFYCWYLLRTQIKGLEMQEVGGIYFGGQLSVFFRKASILKRTIHQNWDKIKNGRITIEVIFIVSLKT